MAKRGRGSRRRGGASGTEDEPDLLDSFRLALTSEEPLDLIAMVSGLLEVTDPRRANPFGPDDRPSLQDLVDSFVGTPGPETTGVLAVIRALVPDQLMAARIGRELTRRQDPLPEWLAGLGQTRAETDVWFLTETLGDGDDYLLGVTLPTGHRLSALIYVDHNLGSVVKDAFVIPDSLSELVDQMASRIDADQALVLTDAADARAAVEQAIDDAARLHPPLESDTWPMCRPVIEWMLRMLPTGGAVAARPEWSKQQLAQLTNDFFRSPQGIPFDDRDGRDLMQSVLWFGTDYGPGDPLRWSPVAVEMLLLDWIPRKVIAEPEFLGQLPAVLKEFVRYAHGRTGVRPGLTAETVSAIDTMTPAYLEAIAGAASNGPGDLLAQLVAANGGQLPAEILEALAQSGSYELDLAELLSDVEVELDAAILDELAQAVGGPKQLEQLDADPLPDEDFAWAGIPEDVRPVVAEMLERCDGCADALLDVEHRTAMRRFLSRAAAADPALFRRKASPVRGAAAIAWAVCRANNTAGGWNSALTTKELLSWFGITGSVSQRAELLLRAVGGDSQWKYGEIILGTPDLLVSSCRARIVDNRDRVRNEA